MPNLVKERYCFACRKPLFRIVVGDLPGLKLDSVMVCTNEECVRIGLLTVVGLQYDLKKEVKKDADNGSHKSHRKKS